MKELFTRISEEKRTRILQAAIDEFAGCGFNNANTNVLAKNAGVSVGSLYKYFENKEDMFLTTINYCASILKEILEEIMQGEEDILCKVEKVIRAIQTHSRQNPKMIQLYNEMSTHSNSHLVLESVTEIESMTSALYTALVGELQAQGEVRSDCDPGMFAFLLDNLFMTLQFSYACDYYRQRFQLYAGDNIWDRDEFVLEQTLKFIKSAFSNSAKS